MVANCDRDFHSGAQLGSGPRRRRLSLMLALTQIQSARQPAREHETRPARRAQLETVERVGNSNNKPRESAPRQRRRASSPAIVCANQLTRQPLLVSQTIILLVLLHNASATAGIKQAAAAAVAAAGPKNNPKRPESSSSLFAEVEDLTDSSIRTRMGRINIEHLGDSPNDFDQLIERITPQEAKRLQSQSFGQSIKEVGQAIKLGTQSRVSADANNRTTMRFFRNNRTFASVVYTNPIQDNQRQPRRLINCHLVDLERHSSDVALYEAKYDIQTIDVEFKDMMQLIEACTNIARLRRRPLINGSGGGGGGGKLQSPAQQQAPNNGGALFAAQHGPGGNTSGLRPTVVVGRPIGAPMATQPASATSNANKNGQSLASFQQIMSGALDRELKQLGPTIDDSNLLDLPTKSTQQQQQQQQPLTFIEMHNHQFANANNDNNSHRHSNHQHLKQQPSSSSTTTTNGKRMKRRLDETTLRVDHQKRQKTLDYATAAIDNDESLTRFEKRALKRYESTMRKIKRQLNSMPLVKTINKVSEASRKLMLGEVTLPPETVSRMGSGAAGGVREAIQEISSYDTSDLLSIWRGILPGTNWCGMGDRATSYNDLGFESDIDICCRAHDFCPIRLAAFSSGYGLFNWSFYTRSHCWCDQNFLDCLQQAESPLSTVVMKFYFTIMKTTCLNDNETANALNQLQPAGSIRPLLQSGATLLSNLQQQQPNNQRSGGLLRVLEQQAAALGMMGKQQQQQQLQPQNKQQSPQQQPTPNQFIIPALKRSRELQKFERETLKQQQQHLN